MDKKIFVLFFCMILLVGTISAFDFDNVKSYDELTKEVTITNAFGLGEDIAKIKLNTPLQVVVPVGYQKVAEFEVDSYNDEYVNALDKIEFYNQVDLKDTIEKQFDYKVWTIKDVEVNDYEYVCTPSGIKGVNDTCINKIVGTHTTKVESWEDLNDVSEWLNFNYKNEEIFNYRIFYSYSFLLR